MGREETSAIASLVTGGAGFVGSHVVDELLERGHEVVALDDLSGGFRDNVDRRATFVEGSVTDDQLVRGLFAEYEFEYVYHLAAYAAEALSHFIRRFNYRNNLIGSVNLINEAVRHGIECFVFTSSIAVYGRDQMPASEDVAPSPEDPYGIAKYAVELDLAAARRMWGLDYIIFRMHNCYGRRQNVGDRYRNVIGIFMNQIMRGEPCTIFGDGQQTRAFTHVSDVAPTIARSVGYLRAYNEVINVGSDRVYTIDELARAVQAAMGRRTGVEYLDAREEIRHAVADHRKAERLLDYEASTSLEDGLADMAEWAREAGARNPSGFGSIEVERGLPPAWI